MPSTPDARAETQRRSWDANATCWTQAVRTGAIASRRAATDAAMVSAVAACAPTTVLDVGCGEGWLARALAAQGMTVTGFDAAATLVEAARAAGGGRFLHRSYAEVAADPSSLGGPFDAAACNFSLLDADLVPLLTALRTVLRPEGRLVLQTVHPWAGMPPDGYHDQWREEDFAGFGEGFRAAMPWYYRTLASWSATLAEAGFVVAAMQEPRHPETGAVLSLLLTARLRAEARHG